ncbi:MAG TPA: [Fe-Fe] hydrogenase large subunit C-terminal domain-containing protein [Patescibacteria group bacterium]|nr:[Fe-Fe] hydrogenase large subunit C-terminal domain-containing protein [Patescibacteria group bacterium]
MNLLDFSKANCKNCYKCLRTCQVKAVKIKNDQAGIVEERCIGCGQCLVVCPQDARNIKSDLADVKAAIKQNKKVIASIAPSFVGAFHMQSAGSFAAALKNLGFSMVEETAAGAEIIAQLYDKAIKSNKHENLITTCCPSANYLVDTYYPSLTEYLIPVVSPMLAHGKLLKQTYGYDSYVVFIGPCTAKKIEALSFQHKGTIDAVLTFEELSRWMEEEPIDINAIKPLELEAEACAKGQAFPLLGGVLNSFGDNQRYEKLRIDGITECMEVLQSIEDGNITGVCLELNICKGGCINGPGMPRHEKDFYKRQKRVKDYITKKSSSLSELRSIPAELDFSKVFIARPIKKNPASDSALKEILNGMGKYEPSDELNCGGCGYNTCREKAQAVFEGMAEMNMCLPYMRGKAESVTNVIFENSPNIILIIDEKLNVKEINPKAQMVFGVKEDFIKERPISIIIDEEPFKLVRDSKKSLLAQRITYPQYGVVLLQNILYLEKQNIILSIMSNITKEEKQREELKRVKENAIDAAQMVIEKQMRVAQEIASLLGETTAETKVTLTKLKEIALQETGE